MKSISCIIFRGVGIQSVVVIANAFLQLAYFSIMSRLLTKEDFGYYGILMAVSLVCNELSSAGLGSAVIQKKNVNNDFIYTAFTLSVLIGTFFTALMCILANQLSFILVSSDTLTIPFRIISIALFIYNINSITRAIYMRNLNFGKYGLITILSCFLAYAVAIFVALKGYGFYSIVCGFFLNVLFVALFSLPVFVKIARFRINKEYVTGIVRFGGWLTFSSLVRSIYEQMDRILTTKWLSIVLIGAYTRATGFVIQASSAVSGVFDTILFPIISGMQNDINKVKEAFSKSTDLVSLFSFIFFSVMVLGAEVFVYLFLGREWFDILSVYYIVSFSLIFFPFEKIGDSFFRSLGYVQSYFYLRVVVCVSAVLLVYIGCTYGGIKGLAIAYVLSRFVDTAMKILVISHFLNIKKRSILKSPIMNCLKCGIVFILSFIVKLLVPNEIVGSLLSLAFYAALMIVIPVYDNKVFGSVVENYVIAPVLRKLKASKISNV